MKNLKVGVVGLGWMGKVHLRVYHQMPGVDVAGVVDTNPETLEAMRAQYDVPAFDNLDALLERQLDAVSVCVPTVAHLPIGLRIMERGVPVLIEKPLAASVEEGETLIAKAHAMGIPLMVGHVERFNPAVARVRELIKDDSVISIQIERVGPYPPRIQDVGVIKDLASHDIDLLRFITGAEFEHVYAVVSRTIGEHEDTALITAQMTNGVLGMINTNWVTPYKSRMIHVATPNRYIEANLITQQVKEYSKFERYDASYSVREWPIMYREPVPEELRQFLAAVRGDAPAPITGEDGLEVLRTIRRIEQTCHGCALPQK